MRRLAGAAACETRRRSDHFTLDARASAPQVREPPKPYCPTATPAAAAMRSSSSCASGEMYDRACALAVVLAGSAKSQCVPRP